MRDFHWMRVMSVCCTVPQTMPEQKDACAKRKFDANINSNFAAFTVVLCEFRHEREEPTLLVEALYENHFEAVRSNEEDECFQRHKVLV